MCPEWDLCAEGAGLLAPTLLRAAGVTTAQAVSWPGAACTVSWSAGPGRAGREGRLVGRAPPRSPPPLPPCPVGLPGGSGVSLVVSGRVTLDSHPHTSVLALDAPRTWRPAPYKCQSGLTRVPAIALWPVTLLHSWGNRGQAHRAQSAPSQRLYRTHLCPPKCPCPHTELHCPGLQWGLQRRWSGRSWGPLGQHTPLRWQTPPHS